VPSHQYIESDNATAYRADATTKTAMPPDDGHADPGDHATAALPGRPAALRPLRGRNFSCCQRQDPLLFTGAITQREFSAISGGGERHRPANVGDGRAEVRGEQGSGTAQPGGEYRTVGFAAV